MELPKGMIHWIEVIYKNRFRIRQSDCLVVMSPCHILTAPLKIFGRKPVILDAGWSLTDGHISRELKIMQFLKLPLVMLIDFISFHFADIVLVESKAQSRRISKYFLVNESKLRVQYTGLNESSFTLKQSDSKVLKSIRKRIGELGYPLIVLFRGKINLESGFENILSAAKKLNDSVVFIFIVGKNDIFRECPRNVIIVSQITDNEMHDIYRLSDISIGQVSTHPRLRYTIPHKAFEAGFFSMPYITADSVGVREYLHQGSALFLEHPSSESLVRAINDLKGDAVRRAYAKKINLIYRESASQKILSEKFDQILLQLCDTKAHKFD
jgi:glycosyltransferase involved in cell wall biosynthesis